jgi:hypothetical protein
MHDRKRMRMHFALVLDQGNEQDKSVACELRKIARESGQTAILDQIRTFSVALRRAIDRLSEFHEKIFLCN